MKKYKSKITGTIFNFLICFLIIISVMTNLTYLNSYSEEMYVVCNSDTEKSTVIIDAGHGGEDCGAIGYNGCYEKDFNFCIANKLGEYLSIYGFPVLYTRSEDKLLYTEEQNIKGMRKIYDLKNRVEIANNQNNAIFISIHMNSF